MKSLIGIVVAFSLILTLLQIENGMKTTTNNNDTIKNFHITTDRRRSTTTPIRPSTNITTSIHSQNTDKFGVSKRQSQPQYSNIALIHVGKTGGTTLLNNLLSIGCQAKATTIGVKQCKERLKEQQRNSDDDSESQISLRTKYIVHYEKVFPIGNIKDDDGSSIRQILLSVSDAFIYTIREPISRFESAYYANSPLHCYFW